MNQHTESRPLQARIILALVALSLMISCLSIYLLYSRSRSIVYVDSQKLIHNYHGMEKTLREMEERTAHWYSQIDTLAQEVKELNNEYKATEKQLSPRERALMKELIQLKQQQFVSYKQLVEDKIGEENRQLTSHALSKIDRYVKQYSKSRGYSIVIAATEYGNLLYTQEATDITDEVVNALNVEEEIK